MLGAGIVLATILYLVDKNHQWKNFWRALAVLVILGALGIGGIYAQKRYEARRNMTPDTYMADHH